MKKVQLSRLFPIILFILLPLSSEGELIDRGGGLIYDTELNITWLQDVNYAKTIGYDEDGCMPWEDAMKFVSDLRYYDSVRDVYWEDWRLPTAKNRDGSGPDRGYYTRNSELGHMYYNNLGNKALYSEESIKDKEKNRRAPTGKREIPKSQKDFGLKNAGPFINLTKEGEFWTKTEAFKGSPKMDPRYPNNAWDFFMSTGTQFYCDKWDHWFLAWPVRDGDVAVDATTATADEPKTEADAIKE